MLGPDQKIIDAKGGVVTINKDAKRLGVPWEEGYGYSQAVKVGDTIYGTVKLSSLAAFSPPVATAKSLILSL